MRPPIRHTVKSPMWLRLPSFNCDFVIHKRNNLWTFHAVYSVIWLNSPSSACSFYCFYMMLRDWRFIQLRYLSTLSYATALEVLLNFFQCLWDKWCPRLLQSSEFGLIKWNKRQIRCVPLTRWSTDRFCITRYAENESANGFARRQTTTMFQSDVQKSNLTGFWSFGLQPHL